MLPPTIPAAPATPAIPATGRHRLGLSGRVLMSSSLREQPGARDDLSLWLIWLYEALSYLGKLSVGTYRLPMALSTAVYRHSSAHMRQLLLENAQLMAEINRRAAALGLRLSIHLPPTCLAHKPLLSTGSSISAAAHFLEALCANGLLVIHGMHPISQSAAQLLALPDQLRSRIVIEPNEHSFSLDDALQLYEHCGCPIVLDTLHQSMYNPQGHSMHKALRVACGTWPSTERPKIHIASQRTEGHIIEARGGRLAQVLAPRPGQHADFINPFEFAMLHDALFGLPGCDLMLEAKAGDMALLRLRDDLRRYAPQADSLLEG